ncbi:hypothetical protein LTR64_001938 [Lithohypha guttulata]|uniref:uncharacterized protein n=1 Tax=Lithohypha guttulata TaxID=1690604 RepID=UPI002DDFD31B|nr:hypothetical protein LTR51_007797 [Lithohypha guttulata]
MSATTTTELEATSLQATPSQHGRNSQHEHRAELTSMESRVETKGTTAVIISAIGGVTLISSMLAGLVTIGLPVIARDLKISDTLLIWPVSIYSLTCGCTLILAGAVADVVGSRVMYLLGTFLQSIFTMACGLSRTSLQLIIFRGFAGVAISFCLPSAVSLIMHYFSSGRRRNLAFAVMGGGQPIGFTLGLVMGGGLTDSLGWQVGFYLGAGINTVLFLLALFSLPQIKRQQSLTLQRLKTDIDWIGAFVLSTSLALLLYVFATWTADIANISSPESISCLALGAALLPAFATWIHRQEKLGKAVLIRNSIWRNKAFTSICVNVFLTWGAFNATEVFLTFFFQDVQGLSATAASIRFLPEPVAGAVTNILIGLYVHRLRADWALMTSFMLSALSPLLLAVMKQGSSYWEYVFPAVALVPISSDVLWTISQLVITAEFEENTQALAGGVFNTVAQIGKSIGLALAAINASSTTIKVSVPGSSHDDQLLEGYRAAWWFTFAATMSCICVTILGLRNIGKVGVKRD